MAANFPDYEVQLTDALFERLYKGQDEDGRMAVLVATMRELEDAFYAFWQAFGALPVPGDFIEVREGWAYSVDSRLLIAGQEAAKPRMVYNIGHVTRRD